MPFHDLTRELSQKLAEHFGQPTLTAREIAADLGAPPKADMGHVALPCFRMAKVLGKPAGQIAKELAGVPLMEGVTGSAAGPYVNFRFDTARLCRQTLQRIWDQKERFGSDASGADVRVVVEYCSPNIAKRLAFQHIRSTLIGNTLSNIYDFLGYRTERINFVGDWGTQFARLLAAVELWGNRDALSASDVEGSMRQLFDLYVRFHKEVETDESLLERASKALAALERQDENATKLWRMVRDISIASMDKTLSRMNVKFNHVEGESAYIPAMEKTLSEVKEKSGARPSEGAWIVEVEGIKTPALIQKRDGTTLYLTRDIAAAIDRYQRFHFDKSYYVVSEQQKLHFRLLFGVLKKMGHDWADRCEHLSFGTVLFGSEKMSTREGRVIFLDDLLNEAKALALKECTEKNPDLPNKDEVAEMIGIGAIIFGNLSGHRTRDIRFEWEQVLALDGETGPYVQYSVVRCHSLLEKAREKGLLETGLEDCDGYEFAAEEDALILALARFRTVLHQVVQENDPFYLTRYLIDVAKTFNRFYYQLPVLQASDEKQRRMRLNLVQATRQVISNGLDLLGIAAPREM